MAVIKKNIKSGDLDMCITIVTPAKNKKVKSIIQIVGGINEDINNYMPFFNFLARKGYVSVINTYSEEKNLNINNIIEKIHHINEYIKEEYPEKTVTLIGNNTGSMIVKNYIQKYDKDINKLIISGSISKSTNLVGIIITKIIRLIKGNDYKCIKLNSLFLPKYFNNYEQVEINVNELEFLLTLNFNSYKMKKYKPLNNELKVLVIAGTEDKIIINEDKFYDICSFFKKIGYKTDYILYKDKEYDLINSDFKNIINEDILNFIEE